MRGRASQATKTSPREPGLAQWSLGWVGPNSAHPVLPTPPSLPYACLGAQNPFRLAHHGIRKCRLGLEREVGLGAHPSIGRPHSGLGREMKSLFF